MRGKASQRDSAVLRAALALAMLAICALLLFRERGEGTEQTAALPAETAPVTAMTQEESPVFQPVEETEPTVPITQVPASAIPAETPVPPTETPAPVVRRPIVYDKRSFQLVTDMVYAFKYQVNDRKRIIADDVQALKEHDPLLGETWGGIMEYWDYADFEMPICYDRLPEDLPRDDSLCLVVLGFQLEPDGSMAQELRGRCELALRAAQQYPHAVLAVCGGGTARGNPKATEAGVMAAWFREQGIDESRILVEDRSSTTEQNALFTREILLRDFPQVKSLVIISSDYHLPLGCTLFHEATMLYYGETGQMPFDVVGNLALAGYGLYEYTNPEEQAKYVWAVAAPVEQSN